MVVASRQICPPNNVSTKIAKNALTLSESQTDFICVGEKLARSKTVHDPATGKFPVIAHCVAAAAPRLDAHKRTVGTLVGRGPESQYGHIEFHSKIRYTVGRMQRAGVDPTAVHNVCIYVKRMRGNGKHTILIKNHRMRLFRFHTTFSNGMRYDGVSSESKEK